MKLHAPYFWARPPGLLAKALTPAAMLYAVGYRWHQKNSKPYQARIPVICIGNIILGGGGKTPCAIDLYRALKEAQLATYPVVLSRGYGGEESGPLLVNPSQHTHVQVGDEPLMMARKGLPVIIAHDRIAGAKIAESRGFDAIIMDDGFQNPRLEKDLSLLVVDGKYGFGNRLLLPSGPLREPIKQGMSKAQAVLLVNRDEYDVRRFVPKDIPIFQAVLRSYYQPHTPTQKVIGFCGLANPEKFLTTLKSLPVNITEFKRYPDHYHYTPQDVRYLVDLANRYKAKLVTTEKDAARLVNFPEIQPFMDVVSISVEWEDAHAFLDFLQEKMPT